MDIIKSEIVKKGKARRKFKEKNGNKCVYCGCTNKLILTVDHINPKIRGGKDTAKNKQVCCFICNQLKGGLTDEEFRKYMIALEILYDLIKVDLQIKINPIRFKPGFYPDYQQIDKKEHGTN